MKKIAVFGGTFNPVHNGHVNLALKVKEELNIDKILIMPTKIPPHKKVDNLASDSDRLNMCHLAFDGYDGFEVCDYEIKHTQTSYTIYTLRYLKEKYQEDKLFFIMGSDMLLTFEKWFCFEEILSLAELIAASREKDDYEKLMLKIKELEIYNGVINVINIEPYVISSSIIRKYVKNRAEFSCYLPKKVVQYISDNKLYI